jgi:hypothetical protein
MNERHEIEIAFAGSEVRFSNDCHCRLLIVPPGQVATGEQISHADLVFSDQPVSGIRSTRLHRLNQIDVTLQQQLGAFQATAAVESVRTSRLFRPAAA